MPKPRSMQVSLDATPYYHCASRCVRRAFLCGFDHQTGESYEHRRDWIEARILQLVDVFAIDVCAYAVMSNHVHTVLYVNEEQASKWSDEHVLERWHKLFAGHPLCHKFLKGELNNAEILLLQPRIDEYRKRLQDISWFMKCLNEDIARQANAEDQCTGRFWEGRFKSQALLDEKALLSCMAYVDLNPIRAKMAETPETSEFTSIKSRIETIKNNTTETQPTSLLPFVGDEREKQPQGIPFKLKDYLELADWTGRVIRADKRGSVHEDLPPILQRLEIDSKQWQQLSQKFETHFRNFVGSEATTRAHCQKLGYQKIPGISKNRQYLN